GLYVPVVPDGKEFAANERIVLDAQDDIRVNLDLSVRAESMRMDKGGVTTVASKAGQGREIGRRQLSLLDWGAIHQDLLNYKGSKNFHNLLVPSDAPRRIMEKTDPVPVYNLVADDSLFEPKSFAGLAELEEAVQAILRKYVDRFYGARQRRWESENMVPQLLTGDHPNFADYTVKIRASEEKLVEEVRALASRVDGDAGGLPNVAFDRHLYRPLLKDRGDEVKVSPPGLEESEERFVAALRSYRERNGHSDGEKLFLLRNLSRGKGVGFFATAGFYPDFILWKKREDGSQKVVFVEPHGMRNDNPPPDNDKVNLYLALEDLSDRIAQGGGPDLHIDSYVVSATPFHELNKKWGEGWTRERFARKHVLFEDDLEERMPDLLAPRDELERRVFAAYPPPLAAGFRSLTRTEDPRDLYREQLRFAENILAFLASVSLALLEAVDREGADVDLVGYWRGGISPGDWRDIVRRCSKVFARYDAPLARAIHGLKIRSEDKGFGRDVGALIRAKNDFKHDRGPKTLEDTMAASEEVQEIIRRCLRSLDFFAAYPMHDPKCPEDVAYLETGGDQRLALYPFIISGAGLGSGDAEIYFVDAWDTKKGTARMKSFETGNTINAPKISEALGSWKDADARQDGGATSDGPLGP
ncbi:MAG: hypothetical protein ACRDTR_07515, partial [Rubrobacter sp.]